MPLILLIFLHAFRLAVEDRQAQPDTDIIEQRVNSRRVT